MSRYRGLAGANDVRADFRSDTVTRPTKGMLAAMQAAELGDDVYGEDPTVNLLETTIAQRLGKETACFFPSGTQSNLAAVMAHCGRGEEALVGADHHIAYYEAAGASVLGSVALWTLPQEEDDGIAAESVRRAIKDDDSHHAITRLLCLENTVSGRPISLARMADGAGAAREAGLKIHLDGARVFNAAEGLGVSAAEVAAPVDTVSACLSKGLGAPVGTCLAGDAETIGRARRLRKMLGGGMRQAGVLAAAGLYALDHHVERLAEDHARAATLAAALGGLGLGAARSATNMAFFALDPAADSDLRAHLAKAGVIFGAPGEEIRLVLHLDIDDAALDLAIAACRGFARAGADAAP